jgi:Cdc6-like AAA superfamily ATPase
VASREAREAAIAQASRIVRADTTGFLSRAIDFPVTIPEKSKPSDNPLIVALYGGPGTGKSTTAALMFGALKQRGHNVELVTEIAKGFTWEERWNTLQYQPYVISKQLRDYDRLYGKVDAMVTDTSSLLGLLYGRPDPKRPEVFRAFSNWITTDWAARRTLNVFLERSPDIKYEAAGRYQDAKEALDLDRRTRELLRGLDVPLMIVPVQKDGDHVADILAEVELCLRP